MVLLEWHADIARRTAYAQVIKPAAYRAPTWSWAAIDVRVFFDYAPHSLIDYLKVYRMPTWPFFFESDNQDGSRTSMPVLRYLDSYILASVVETEVSTHTEYRLGKVHTGDSKYEADACVRIAFEWWTMCVGWKSKTVTLSTR